MKFIYMGIGFAIALAGPPTYAHGSRHNSAASRHHLSAKQCSHLQNEVDRYESTMRHLMSRQPKLASLFDRAIKMAEKFVNRMCPPMAPAAPTPDECNVANASQTGIVSLGLDSSQNLTNSDSPPMVACMTETACLSIASQAFPVLSADATSRCADPNDTTAVHLSDAQVQQKVNALSGN